MDRVLRKRLIDVAAGREEADLVISNAHVVDVFTGTIREGDVAVVGGFIAGVGSYSGAQTIDANGRYLIPGLIDGHVHIESSLVDPPSFAQLVVPHGTTTVIADPHEICNVCGLDGLDYMIDASEGLNLDIFFMIPSCVPATPFEHSGATLDAQALRSRIDHPRVLGLGEMMDMVGTIAAEERILDKLDVADHAGTLVDGHGPGLMGSNLNAYCAAGILTDHECATTEELQDRISRGMYVLLREGSACQDLRNLLPAVNSDTVHMCLFCTDDRQPKSILESGHIDNHLRIAVAEGIDPIQAIRMATINAARCFRLYDRGAIAPGLQADMVIVDDLVNFHVSHVFTKGELYDHEQQNLETPLSLLVSGRVDIGSFSERSLELRLKSSHVRVIDVVPKSVVTEAGEAEVFVDSQGLYQNDRSNDIVKLAVVERHRGTGHVGLALLRGYGIADGAIATTIAHDSHNIIVVGDNDSDMALAVTRLKSVGGGIVLVQRGEVLDALPLPIAGLMTNKGAHSVESAFQVMHELAQKRLKVNDAIDPFMTLSFMALPVIPHLKVTDMGLFDVDRFSFVSLEL